MDELEARIEALAAQEELQAIKPPLDGKQVMDFLGVAPGPVVGEALGVPARGPPRGGSDRADEAYERLRRGPTSGLWSPTGVAGLERSRSGAPDLGTSGVRDSRPELPT